MNKWFWILGMLWLAGCGTDSDDGLTDDERRSKEIWSIISMDLWATYNPAPEDFTVYSDSILVQQFLDTNGLSTALRVRDIARAYKDEHYFKQIRVNLSELDSVPDTLIIPSSWSKLKIVDFELYRGEKGGITYISGLSNLATIKELNITGTQISKVPEEVVNFDLALLAISYNRIIELPEWVIDYVDSNRTILWINNNQIQKMPENLIQKHWQIRISGNLICNISAEDSIAIHELSISGTGGYIQQGEYLSNPALGFFPQNCD